MASKIKEAVNSPYMAPLTQPFKNVTAFTLYPLRGIIAALHGKYHDATPIDVLATMAGMAGAVGGALGFGTFAAGSALSALGTSAVAIKIVSAISAAMAGGLAGAIGGAIAGLGAAAAVAGIAGLTFGFVPGIFQGLGKAWKHHHGKNPLVRVKTQIPPRPPAPRPPPPPPRNPSGLPPKSLTEQLAKKSPEDRQKILAELKAAFADDFSTLAQKEVAASLTISAPLTIKSGPLRYQRQKAVPPQNP